MIALNYEVISFDYKAMIKQRKDTREYKKLQLIIKKEIKTAKERWMTEKCEEMADLIAKHDTFGMHRKVTEIADMHKKLVTMMLLDDRNKIILGKTLIKNTWESYVTQPFKDISRQNLTIWKDLTFCHPK